MHTHSIELSTANGPMRLYEAVPDQPAEGAVIVIQEAFGVNGHIEDVTRRFAEADYHSVAPDLYHRADGAVVAYDDIEGIMGLMGGLTDEAGWLGLPGVDWAWRIATRVDPSARGRRARVSESSRAVPVPRRSPGRRSLP